LPLAVCLFSVGLATYPATAQTQPSQASPKPVITVGSLVADGYVVRGVSMPDHHAVNFIAQKSNTIYWCEGTNFGAVLLGKEPAIETRCYEVK
jgi:hypothetical protein